MTAARPRVLDPPQRHRLLALALAAGVAFFVLAALA